MAPNNLNKLNTYRLNIHQWIKYTCRIKKSLVFEIKNSIFFHTSSTHWIRGFSLQYCSLLYEPAKDALWTKNNVHVQIPVPVSKTPIISSVTFKLNLQESHIRVFI